MTKSIKEVIKKLTHEDLTTIISRFSSSMYKLETSGDYPEKQRDQLLLRKLIDMQFIQSKKKMKVTVRRLYRR